MPKIFNCKIKKGKAIGAQKGLVDDLKKLFSIVENMEGIGGIEIKRDGVFWRFAITSSMAGGGGSSSGGVPTGYTERSNSIVDIQVSDTDPKKIQVKRGTVLCKDVDASWSDLLTPSSFAD